MVVAITADTTAVITAAAVMVIQLAQLRRAWPLARRLAWRSEQRQLRLTGRQLITRRHQLRLPAAIIPTLHVHIEDMPGMAEREAYDLVVMDTAPHADQAALRVARLAGLVLVPVRRSILDLDAVGASLDPCALAGGRRPAAAVLNAAPIRSRVVQEAADIVVSLGGAGLMETVVRERVALRHAFVDGRVAREFEPGGAAAAEIAALYMETCKRVHIQTGETV
jgi:cellulose biosynthesis protein BcsQ